MGVEGLIWEGGGGEQPAHGRASGGGGGGASSPLQAGGKQAHLRWHPGDGICFPRRFQGHLSPTERNKRRLQ